MYTFPEEDFAAEGKVVSHHKKYSLVDANGRINSVNVDDEWATQFPVGSEVEIFLEAGTSNTIYRLKPTEE